MASFFAVLATTFVTTAATAEIFNCPQPPPTASTDERFGGGVKANLNWFLSSLGLNFNVRKVENDILSRYPNSSELFQKLFYFSQNCHIILAKSIPDSAKLQQLEELTKEIFGVVLNVTPQPQPQPQPLVPIPHSRIEPSNAATQLMRLILDNSSTLNDIIGKLSVPFCSGNVLMTKGEVRDLLEEDNKSKPNVGRFIVNARDTKIIGEIDFDSPYSGIPYGSNTWKGVKQCRDIILPLDYMIFVEVKLIDLKKVDFIDVIVERESGLIKGWFHEGYSR